MRVHLTLIYALAVAVATASCLSVSSGNGEPGNSIAPAARVQFAAGPFDSDGDGCSDAQEAGTNPALGGQRDANNPWDFYDVNASKKVDAADIALVRWKFNPGGPVPAPDRIYDRSTGAQPWAPGPPDDRINGVDIALVRVEFGHSCRPPAGDPVVLAAGDIASCSSSGDEATAALLVSLQGTVVTLGDNVYENGTPAEFVSCYDPGWGHQIGRTWPAAGNHDYNTPGATGYYGYFGPAAGDSSKGYYSYELGAWHVIVINSNCAAIGGCDAGSAQEQWLRADLAAHPATCTMSYWHHPRFSSGSTHGDNGGMQAIWQALQDFGGDLVLSGHEHNYERFAPQTATGAADDMNGIIEIVAGTGGRSHYGFGSPKANSIVRNSDTFGVLKLILHPASFDWQFIPEADKSFADQGSANCH